MSNEPNYHGGHLRRTGSSWCIQGMKMPNAHSPQPSPQTVTVNSNGSELVTACHGFREAYDVELTRKATVSSMEAVQPSGISGQLPSHSTMGYPK